MSQQHTPEPWRVFSYSWSNTSVLADGFDHAICGLDINHATEDSQESDEALMGANARRIVACVNALAGVATEELEQSGFISGLLEQVECSTITRDNMEGRLNILIVKLAAMKEERDDLQSELERERMRLAACGVVAMADTPDSAVKAREMRPEYHSASCDDVARRVDECISLRKQRDELLAALETIARSLPQIACERAQMMDFANKVIASAKGGTA